MDARCGLAQYLSQKQIFSGLAPHGQSDHQHHPHGIGRSDRGSTGVHPAVHVHNEAARVVFAVLR